MDEQLRGEAKSAVLPELEARLLEASLRQRLFRRPHEPVQLGRYRLLERLGHGAMGVVYRAHDDQLDRQVAVKLLHSSAGGPDATSRARLRREAQALARLSHPNVVQVFEIGDSGEQVFVAMELVRGVTLRAWLGERARPVDDIVEVFVQAGRGLAAAHAAGLVHRDFKPENVLVGADGRVRVVDFGLVRERDAELGETPATSWRGADPEITATGALLGTPAYMAPEQARGGAPTVDARSDQFAFCVALYEALYGERPFAGANLEAYLRAVAAGAVRPAAARAAVPARVRRVLLRGLQAEPDARWPAMEPLLAALAPARTRLRVVAIAVVLAAAMVAVVAGVFVGLRAHAARERERVAAERVAVIERRWVEQLAAGDRAGAEQLVVDLAAAPEIRGTAVGATLWSRWARLLERHGAAAPEAWANAYVQARDAAARDEALVHLGAAYRIARRWDGLQSAVALIAAEVPALWSTPEVAAMRFDVAVAHGDVPTALALARDPAAPPERAALAPALAPFAALTATPHRHVHRAQPIDVDGGRAILLTARPPGEAEQVIVADAAGELAPRRRELLHDVYVARVRDPALVVDDAGDAVVLRAGARAGFPALQSWPSEGRRVIAARAIDLDRDGDDEVYVAGQRGLRALVRDPGGAWRRTVPHAGSDAALSDADALTAGDLDGDGQPELVVAFGPWSAYDVRVFRSTVAGELTQVARLKLGHTAGVTVIRTPAGPRIVAFTTASYPSSTVFPADHPSGAPRGFHLLRLDGEALVRERSLLLPDTEAEGMLPRGFHVGDIDGDGRDDIVAGVERASPSPGLARHAIHLARQLPDGDFAQTTLGGMCLVNLAQLDDDAALEVLFVAGDDRALWIAGAGEQTLAPARPFAPGPAEAHAAVLAGAGAPADVVALARAGAADLALGTAVQVAALADAPQRRRLHLAAAGIAADLHDRERAIALLTDAADDPALRPAALDQLVAAQLELGQLEAAADAGRQWLATPELPTDVRERAAAIVARLERLVTRRTDVPLRLAGAGAVVEPSALRRDPQRGTLVLDSFAGRRVALAWRLADTGGPFVIELAAAPIELQWSSTLELRVVAGDVDVARAAIRTEGGDAHQQLALNCGAAHSGIGVPVRPDGAVAPFVLRLLVDPPAGTVECRLAPGDGQAPLVLRERLEGAPSDHAWLELGAQPGFGATPLTRARIEVKRLTLGGATLGAPAADDRSDEAAALLVDGAPIEALAALEARAGPRASLWRAVALAELGRFPAAAEALRAALADPRTAPDDELRHFLVNRTGTFGPVVRHVLGEPRTFALHAEAWLLAHGRRRFSTELLRAILTELAGLESACGDADTCRILLRMRGRAHAQAGDPPRARADLERAVALGEGDDPRSAAMVRVDLAALAAADGDAPAALEHARTALALHPARDVCRDVLRAREELAPLLTTPAWRALLGPDDRALDPA